LLAFAESSNLSKVMTMNRERFSTAAELAGLVVGIAVIVTAVVGWLEFLQSECQQGTPFLPAVFVCFPPE
jgi:hypothetical protein